MAYYLDKRTLVGPTKGLSGAPATGSTVPANTKLQLENYLDLNSFIINTINKNIDETPVFAVNSLDIQNGGQIVAGTTTGLKIGGTTTQKLGFWNTTPVVQPTTAVATSAFVANTSGIADDTATFGGYKISQVVKALQLIGILA